jgi:hypothetical protein
MTRRNFSLALGAAGLTGGISSAAAIDGNNYPIRRRRKVEILFQSPEGHPNGLEATEDGLWVAEQISDRAHLLDWETGKSLVAYETQSSNTSGIAAGNGLVFMGANGPGKLRPRRPHDVVKGGRIVKLDAKTGKHIQNFQTPSGGGLHGLLWAKDFLWVTQFNPGKILKADADANVFHDFDTPLSRAHGLGWDGEFIWCMFSNDYRILRFDIKSGRVIEAIQLDSSDPDPHGMTWWNGNLYYCDAGIAPGFEDSKSKHAGAICRIHV